MAYTNGPPLEEPKRNEEAAAIRKKREKREEEKERITFLIFTPIFLFPTQKKKFVNALTLIYSLFIWENRRNMKEKKTLKMYD